MATIAANKKTTSNAEPRSLSLFPARESGLLVVTTGLRSQRYVLLGFRRRIFEGCPVLLQADDAIVLLENLTFGGNQDHVSIEEEASPGRAGRPGTNIAIELERDRRWWRRALGHLRRRGRDYWTNRNDRPLDVRRYRRAYRCGSQGKQASSGAGHLHVTQPLQQIETQSRINVPMSWVDGPHLDSAAVVGALESPGPRLRLTPWGRFSNRQTLCCGNGFGSGYRSQRHIAGAGVRPNPKHNRDDEEEPEQCQLLRLGSQLQPSRRSRRAHGFAPTEAGAATGVGPPSGASRITI